MRYLILFLLSLQLLLGSNVATTENEPASLIEGYEHYINDTSVAFGALHGINQFASSFAYTTAYFLTIPRQTADWAFGHPSPLQNWRTFQDHAHIPFKEPTSLRSDLIRQSSLLAHTYLDTSLLLYNTPALTRSLFKGAEHSLQSLPKHLSHTPKNLARTSRIGAENASIALTKKLSQLEKAQSKALQTRVLPDGRIRYYGQEYPSTTIGQTRGACRVTEYNPTTSQTRSWHECYNHAGNVNRVHPKQLNGQDIIGPHYPPIASEISCSNP